MCQSISTCQSTCHLHRWPHTFAASAGRRHHRLGCFLDSWQQQQQPDFRHCCSKRPAVDSNRCQVRPQLPLLATVLQAGLYFPCDCPASKARDSCEPGCFGHTADSSATCLVPQMAMCLQMPAVSASSTSQYPEYARMESCLPPASLSRKRGLVTP